jgi:hypothetical protein
MKKWHLTLLGLFISTPLLANIEIQNAWVAPSDGPTASLYMKIINTSNEPDRLVSVQNNSSLLSEFHLKQDTGNRNEQTIAASFQIPPRGNIQLNPEQNHIVLQNIRGPLKVGNTVKVKLVFSSGQKVELNVPVKDTGKAEAQPNSNSLLTK